MQGATKEIHQHYPHAQVSKTGLQEQKIQRKGHHYQQKYENNENQSTQRQYHGQHKHNKHPKQQKRTERVKRTRFGAKKKSNRYRHANFNNANLLLGEIEDKKKEYKYEEFLKVKEQKYELDDFEKRILRRRYTRKKKWETTEEAVDFWAKDLEHVQTNEIQQKEEERTQTNKTNDTKHKTKKDDVFDFDQIMKAGLEEEEEEDIIPKTREDETLQTTKTIASKFATNNMTGDNTLIQNVTSNDALSNNISNTFTNTSLTYNNTFGGQNAQRGASRFTVDMNNQPEEPWFEQSTTQSKFNTQYSYNMENEYPQTTSQQQQNNGSFQFDNESDNYFLPTMNQQDDSFTLNPTQENMYTQSMNQPQESYPENYGQNNYGMSQKNAYSFPQDNTYGLSQENGYMTQENGYQMQATQGAPVYQNGYGMQETYNMMQGQQYGMQEPTYPSQEDHFVSDVIEAVVEQEKEIQPQDESNPTKKKKKKKKFRPSTIRKRSKTSS